MWSFFANLKVKKKCREKKALRFEKSDLWNFCLVICQIYRMVHWCQILSGIPFDNACKYQRKSKNKNPSCCRLEKCEKFE